MFGFLNVDKPAGITSHDVVARVRRVAGLKRVGHAGTLDPLATGVLVVGLGRATRLIEYVMGRPKTYLTTVRLGQTTNTWDADGMIEQERPVNVPDAEIEAALKQFRGEILQVPPMFSAIKRDGQPLYKLARKGETIEVPPRRVTIYALDFVRRDGNDVVLRVGCSTGTYIRALAHDLGETLGCGGHVLTLRREAVGAFSAENAIPLDNLTSENVAASLLSVNVAIDHLVRMEVSAETKKLLSFGKRITLATTTDADLIRVYHEEQLLGLLRREGPLWHPHKMFISNG